MALPGTPYLCALAFVAGGAAAWKVQDWRADSEELGRGKAAEVIYITRAAAVDSGASAVVQFIEKERIKYVYVNKTVREVVKTPFYAADAPLCLDDAGLRALATTRESPPAPSSAASAVRGNGIAAGRSEGNGLRVDERSNPLGGPLR